MTHPTTPLPSTTPATRRHVTSAAAALAAGLVVLSGCAVGGRPVDAGVDAPAPAGPECPEWVVEILDGSVADGDLDVDGLGDHYRDRAVVLDRIADGLQTDDAAVIRTYADAVGAFGEDPLSPGVSRKMGEAAADAAVVASQSC